MLRKLIALIAIAVVAVGALGMYLYSTATASAEVENIGIVDVAVEDGRIYVLVNASIRNPSGVGATVESIDVKVYHEGEAFGSLELLKPLWIGGGETVQASLRLRIEDLSVFSELLGRLLSGGEVRISYEGVAHVKAGPIPVTVPVSGDAPFRLKKMFEIRGVSGDEKGGVLEVTVTNMFSIDIVVSDAKGALYYGERIIGRVDGVVGHAEVPGGSKADVSVRFTPANIESLIEKVLIGSPVSAVFKGNVTMDVGGVKLNVPVIIEEQVSIALNGSFGIVNFRVGPVIQVRGLLKVSLGLFKAPIRIKELTASLSSEGAFLGEVKLSGVDVVPGGLSEVNVTYLPSQEGLSMLLSIMLSPERQLQVRVSGLKGTIEVYGMSYDIDSRSNFTIGVSLSGVESSLSVTVKSIEKVDDTLNVLVRATLSLYGSEGGTVTVRDAVIDVAVDGVTTKAFIEELILSLGEPVETWVSVDFKPFKSPLSELISKAVLEGLDLRVVGVRARLSLGYVEFDAAFSPNWNFRLSPFRIDVSSVTIEDVSLLEEPSRFVLTATVNVGTATIEVSDIYVERLVADIYLGDTVIARGFEIDVNSTVSPNRPITVKLRLPISSELVEAVAGDLLGDGRLEVQLRNVRVWARVFGQYYPEINYPDISVRVSLRTSVEVLVEQVTFEKPGDQGRMVLKVSLADIRVPVRFTELSGRVGDYLTFELDKYLDGGYGWFELRLKFHLYNVENASEIIEMMISGGNATLPVSALSAVGYIGETQINIALKTIVARISAEPILRPEISVSGYKLVPPGDVAEVYIKFKANLSYDLGAPINVVGGSFEAYDRQLGIKIGQGTIKGVSSSITYDYQVTDLTVAIKLERGWVSRRARSFVDGGVIEGEARKLIVKFRIYETEYSARFPEMRASITTSRVSIRVTDAKVKVRVLAGLATEAEATVHITNPYSFDVTVSSARFNVYDSNGHVFIGSGSYQGPVTIRAGSTVSIRVTLPISHSAASRVASYCDWSTNRFSIYVDFDGTFTASVYSLAVSDIGFERRRVHVTGTCVVISIIGEETYNTAGGETQGDIGGALQWSLSQHLVRSHSSGNTQLSMESRRSSPRLTRGLRWRPTRVGTARSGYLHLT